MRPGAALHRSPVNLYDGSGCGDSPGEHSVGRFLLVVSMIALLSFESVPLACADPIVIAHRGASGYVPEHTLEAYAMAYAQGADYIEPDLVLTKDDVFICLHDIHLEATTDVEALFPDRRRDDGSWYAIDFSLDEIKSLHVHERLEGRFPVGKSSFEVPTFEEMIELVQGLNQTTGRTVGIYPELKAPSFHREEGHPVEALALELLSRYGYVDADSPVYVQCFEPDTLNALRDDFHTTLKLVQLIGDEDEFAPLRTEQGIEAIARYADGIGPHKGDINSDPRLVKWALSRGLEVHPYTFRADDVGEGFESFDAELERYIDVLQITGLFTDQTDRVLGYLTDNSKKD